MMILVETNIIVLHVGLERMNVCIVGKYNSIVQNKGCFGHWQLDNSKLLFGGHSGKSLHCLVCPNA